MSVVYYVIRYLPPKILGEGEIAHAFASAPGLTLEDTRERYPRVFEQPGFYTLMVGTGETFTVGASNG